MKRNSRISLLYFYSLSLSPRKKYYAIILQLKFLFSFLILVYIDYKQIIYWLGLAGMKLMFLKVAHIVICF